MVEVDKTVREVSSALHCRDLSVVFGQGRPAVDAVTWSFEAGQITSLVGPSGCGKTTLLRTIARLQRATSGTIEMVPEARPERGEIAFVFQQPTLLPWLTAFENVLLPLQLGVDGDPKLSHRQRAVNELLAMELDEDAWNRYPHALSGGMKMRVSLARALVTKPSILLLDEPFAALDEMLRLTLSDLLLRRWTERPITMVLVTHNITEAATLSHSVLVMRSGRITASIEDSLPRPRDESVRTSAAFGELYRKISAALRGEKNE